jgi:deoxyribonuclease-4
MKMVRVGCHVSIAKAIELSVDRALRRTCDTFQIFTRSPRGWKSRELEDAHIEAFRQNVAKSGIDPVVAHMPYLPNLASPDPEVYDKSLLTLKSELSRCSLLGIPYLVMHLGSHRGAGWERGAAGLISGINQALEEAGNGVMLLLENTAGTKNSLGGTFEDINAILSGIEKRSKVGVCFDTCHAFAAGYELSSKKGVRETLDQFDAAIGGSHLKVVHLNDSRGECGSRLDRHEHIGLGQIGEKGFEHILHHPLIRSRPLICETPVDDRRNDRGNIDIVRELAK